VYGPGVSRETVSRVTNAVLEDAKAWQTRPLEATYPILYLDALVIKIRDGQAIRNFSGYLVIGVNLEGDRDVPGDVVSGIGGREDVPIGVKCGRGSVLVRGCRRGWRCRAPTRLGL
jgi:transposase-like protein